MFYIFIYSFVLHHYDEVVSAETAYQFLRKLEAVDIIHENSEYIVALSHTYLLINELEVLYIDKCNGELTQS